MNYIYIASGILFGASLAFFFSGNASAAWLDLGALAVLVFVVSAHLTGIRKGEKRAATDL